jgi:4-diphosphocytidyl-2-C-methyl-D-erythritol kinase
MQLQAFAKINLDLRVLGRRDDGYHELRTIFQTIDWSDQIQIEAADEFTFLERGIAVGEQNLVAKAVRAFERMTGVSVRARIELTKGIPSGAGLGGGSADAAVTILGLQELYGTEIPQADLLSALSTLGSDVPFFLFGGRALGTGRGNEVALLEDDVDYGLVVVVPPLSVATREAYSWLTVSDKSNSISRFCAQPAAHSEVEPGNDFESVVFPRLPLLSEIKQDILRAGALRASLSGTGSALFGIFGSREEAEQAVPRLSAWGVAKASRPLSRPEYLRRIWGVAKW